MQLFDITILEFFHSLSSPWLDRAAVTLTQLGGAIFITVFTATTTAGLLIKNHLRSAAYLAIAVGGAGLLNLGLKLLFQRDRPALWEVLTIETTYAFPSGHAMASSALAFALIALLWRTKWKRTAIFIGLIYVAIIGFTRVYLGVHFPSDVIAGWAISLGWVLLVFRAAYWREPHRR